MYILRRLLQKFRFTSRNQKWVPDQVYPDDTFIVSYPKSGNTWMRFLVGNYLTGNKCSFENCHQITPDIHMNPERCEEVDRPRFIKSHAPYRSQYPNVIYIVRDARDVAVSYYHHSRKMEDISEETTFSEFLEIFNRGEVDPYGSWSDHVQSWMDQKKDDLLLVRYEDLLDDAEQEFLQVLKFANLAVDKNAARSAVEASRFENMQRQEREQQDRVNVLSKSDKSKRFVRKGKRGNWRKIFGKREHERFLKAHGSVLRKIGYVE